MDRTPQRHAESLLDALDPLPFPQRMRELALRVKERAPLRPVLEELESRGPYERGIAVGGRPRGRGRRAGGDAARPPPPHRGGGGPPARGAQRQT
ncbi:hypothetical protein ACFWIZ_55720, partial [Streptomyces sp. NPDC127044]